MNFRRPWLVLCVSRDILYRDISRRLFPFSTRGIRDKVLDRKFGSEILEIEYFIASLGRLCNSFVDQYL